MKIQRCLLVAISTLLLATGGILVSMPAHADTPGQERRDDRGDGRDVRQEGRQDSRKAKKECKKGDEKSRAECRQDKRGSKQDAREGARDTRKGGAAEAEAPTQP